MAFVGAGGKTTALRRLARELSARGQSTVVTTTTKMKAAEVEDLGPLVLNQDERELALRLCAALADGRLLAAAAGGLAPDGKVAGLAPATVDRLWRERLADHILVEADGSKGRPFKAFGRHEPQVPRQTTVIVQVAGLDAIGAPLTDEYVHRAETLAAAAALPLGAGVTEEAFVCGLRSQLRRLENVGDSPRIITLLNKADDRQAEALGRIIARRLGGRQAVPGGHRPAWSLPGAPVSSCPEGPCPDAVVVASLHRGRFLLASAGEAASR